MLKIRITPYKNSFVFHRIYPTVMNIFFTVHGRENFDISNIKVSQYLIYRFSNNFFKQKSHRITVPLNIQSILYQKPFLIRIADFLYDNFLTCPISRMCAFVTIFYSCSFFTKFYLFWFFIRIFKSRCVHKLFLISMHGLSWFEVKKNTGIYLFLNWR